MLPRCVTAVAYARCVGLSELEQQLQANPDDDDAWLVYADFLLERGDPRGDCIRERRQPDASEREQWRGGIPALAISEWRCGFVVGIDLPLDARTPHTLRTILADPEARFVSSLRLRRARSWSNDDYHVSPAIETDGDPLTAVLELDLSRIRAFGLPYQRFAERFDEDEIGRILGTLGSLVSLDLRYCDLGDSAAVLLARTPGVRSLRRLHLQGNRIGEVGARAIAASPYLRDLELLDVRYNPIGAAVELPGMLAYPEDVGEASFVKRFVAPDRPPVYVDPRELSFHTYENIVPLDRWFEPIDVELAEPTTLADDVMRFTLRGGDALLRLDELPLYAAPLDTTSRGGQRYIFHCAQLAESLGSAVRAALPESMRAGFSHVNPVFRCNRFEPGDAPFHPHLDTPYFDADRHHVSRYTLIVYLTGGHGTLQIGDVALDTIEPMTCVVFHQRYEHAGTPYADGRKVFLRTELIFEDRTVEHDPRIAAVFARACYLTGESMRAPELARDAAAAYNRVAAAHWQGLRGDLAEPFVHKQFRGVRWLANGYDFWFSKETPLVECAALTLLDYLNCQFDDKPFRAACTSEVVRDIDPEAFVARFPSARACGVVDKSRMFPSPEAQLRCCPTHTRSAFDPTVSDDVVELYDAAQRFARDRIAPAPILMLGQEVFLDPSRFVVEGNRIHVLSAERLAPVNFAACWNSNSRPPNYVDVDAAVGVVQPLVPPILWEATASTHHLMFDFFRNSWAARHEQLVVPIPKIRRVDYETVDESEEPWLSAAARANPRAAAKLPAGQRYPWWTGYTEPSLLVRELFRPDESAD